MNATIRHRGPDGEGIWVDGPIGLAHRRLAIIDLTASARQPMSNETGDVIIVYNGELYNFLQLRVELEAAGHRFHSNSDTEVVVHAYEEWGTCCLERFNGMFAFAIWDQRSRKLFLARDRFGVKPLYYCECGGTFLFTSEIKAILAYPGFRKAVCYPALHEYFTFQNVLSDLTLFEGVRLLPAGHYLTVSADRGQEHRPICYWDFDLTGPCEDLSQEDAAAELQRLFVQAVTRQLVSDVPVGTYLSGGMDSGSISAVARRYLGRLTAFTCGFDLSSASGLEMGYDERPQAEILANLLKTEHYEIVMHAGDMECVMPDLIWHLEDLRVGQCYPNYYVARLASKFVKVVLSGAGGDELFAGYPWRYYRGLNGNGGRDYYRNYYNFWQRLVPDEEKADLFQPGVWQQIAGHSTFALFRDILERSGPRPATKDQFINAALYFELKTFLHGLLLVEDKMSMAHSLETRVPFLDNDLVDFACRLAPAYKLRHLNGGGEQVDENDVNRYQAGPARTGEGKAVLRDAMRRLMPSQVTERIKQGFAAPDASWFRGDSVDYVNRLLRDPAARIHEFLNPQYLARRLDEHTSGRHNHRLFIWSALSFEWWLRKFAD